jgi:hypothetical protein
LEKPSALVMNINPVNGFISAVFEGRQITLLASSPQFEEAVEARKLEDWDRLYELMQPAKVVEKFSTSVKGLEVRDGEVLYQGIPLGNSVVDRILEYRRNGINHSSLVNFLGKLLGNPSYQSIQELYLFLEHKHLPITDEGDFIAYKVLNPNFKDIRTGTIDNSPGQSPSMERSRVDDNRSITCSYGLHVGTYNYASTQYGTEVAGRKIIMVSVNPADVVSVPADHNDEKCRVCKYHVIEEVSNPVDTYSQQKDTQPCCEEEDYEEESYEEVDLTQVDPKVLERAVRECLKDQEDAELIEILEVDEFGVNAKARYSSEEEFYLEAGDLEDYIPTLS